MKNVLTDMISLLFAQWMCHSETLSNKMVSQNGIYVAHMYMDLTEEAALSVDLVVGPHKRICRAAVVVVVVGT